MAKLYWGRGIGIQFADNNEYFFTLGYLANHKRHPVVVYTHSNDESGAWAGQGKLELKKPHGTRGLPRPLATAFTQSGDQRLSVTDYVKQLVGVHGFTDFRDPTGNGYTYYRFPNDIESVRSTVPAECRAAFDLGYSA